MEKVIVTPGFKITPNIPIPSLRGRVISGEELGFISATADFRSTVFPLSPNKEYTVN